MDSVTEAIATPFLRLGGASPGGLMLPPADATPNHMYAPRGVWTDGERIAVCDTGNHRVLIWNQLPTADGTPADVVLGQADFISDAPAAGGTDFRGGMYLPTGVDVIGDNLVIADAWHHRLLVFDGFPARNLATPRYAIGQPDLDSITPNRGGEPSMSSLHWPFGFGVVGETFWVTDTGNRRVLGWHGADLPAANRPADILLGQDSQDARADNRGGDVGPVSFRWPHAVAGDDQTLYVADAGDHRILGWTPHPIDGERPADVVLGQENLTTNDEFKNRPQGAQRLRFPYGVAVSGGQLWVADTSNNRLLCWTSLPRSGFGILADHQIGQVDFDANGENRWESVRDDTLCWPYGLSIGNGIIAIADSGNNRAMFWRNTS